MTRNFTFVELNRLLNLKGLTSQFHFKCVSVLVSDNDCHKQPSYEWSAEGTKWF